MTEVLRGRGCDVTLAANEFTDPRYAGRFQEFPMPHPFRELVGMIPAESPRRRPAKIVVPDVVTEQEYDLVCIGSPTWWLSTDVPVRSFLQSDTASRVLKGKPFAAAVCCRRYWRHNLKTVRRLGTKQGGVFAAGIHPLPGRASPLASVAAELSRVRRVPRPVSRSQDPADQHPGLPPGGGTGIRGSAGKPTGIHWRAALAERTRRGRGRTDGTGRSLMPPAGPAACLRTGGGTGIPSERDDAARGGW